MKRYTATSFSQSACELRVSSDYALNTSVMPHLIAQGASEYCVSCGDVVQLAVHCRVSVRITLQSVAREHVCWFDLLQ